MVTATVPTMLRATVHSSSMDSSIYDASRGVRVGARMATGGKCIKNSTEMSTLQHTVDIATRKKRNEATKTLPQMPIVVAAYVRGWYEDPASYYRNRTTEAEITG